MKDPCSFLSSSRRSGDGLVLSAWTFFFLFFSFSFSFPFLFFTSIAVNLKHALPLVIKLDSGVELVFRWISFDA